MPVGSLYAARQSKAAESTDITGTYAEDPGAVPMDMAREEELARTNGQTYVADGTGPVAVRRLQRASGGIDFAACEANQAAGGKTGVVAAQACGTKRK